MITSLNRKMINRFPDCHTFLSSENLVLDQSNVTYLILITYLLHNV